MAVTGNIDLWSDRFPDDQIDGVIHLVLDSWVTFKLPPKRWEVPITRKLCAHLRKSRNRSTQFFRIDWESYVVDDAGKVAGRIDLRFSQGLDEDVYFSLECKLLRVQSRERFDSLAGKYVTEGMFRYFTGQYAEGQNKGGMLGYVMDGRVGVAIEDVTKSIERYKPRLHMVRDDTLRVSNLSSHRVRESFHEYGPDSRFVIYHIFLPVELRECNRH